MMDGLIIYVKTFLWVFDFFSHAAIFGQSTTECTCQCVSCLKLLQTFVGLLLSNFLFLSAKLKFIIKGNIFQRMNIKYR